MELTIETNMNAQIEIKDFAGRVLYTHQPADSSGMTMRHALEAAAMAGADLRGAYLRGADLTDANLRGANLRGASLTGANLRGANLRGADLRVADLTGADLTGASLTDADLRVADLRGADLTSANLRGANLRGADLRGADLTGASLRGADLTNADLRVADLTDASLTDATIYGIKITRTPVTIDGLRWGVTIIDGHIKIGCQFHPIGAWSAFDDAVIAAMDGRDALRFWREHKAVIMALAAPFAAMPAGEAPADQMRDDLAGARESITSGELFTGDDLAVRDGANSRRENEMELDEFEGHTPGPLACVELMAFAAGFAVEDGEGRTVARIMKTHGVERLPSRANAALFAAAPELLAEVRRLTAEAAELRRERDELAARLEAIEQAEPVAWIEHELQGTGLRHLHFERRPNTLRDEVVDPVWTELIARPVPAAAPDRAELAQAREVLADCATTLESYARHHAERGPEHAHKVTRNAELAARCRAALAAKE